MLTLDQIQALADNPSQSFQNLLSVDASADVDPDEQSFELASRKIRLTEEFWTGATQYRATWPEGIQARKQYAFVQAEVKKKPDEISPEFVGLVKCMLSSGLVTAAIVYLYHKPDPATSQEVIATIITAATSCWVMFPVTPGDFTENIIKASIPTRWGKWG